jgi:hypothetical protein
MVKSKRYVSETGSKRVYNALTTLTKTGAELKEAKVANLNEKVLKGGVTVNGAFVLDSWTTATLATNYTVPETAVAGAMYFDTTTSAIMVHNGTAWKQVSVET